LTTAALGIIAYLIGGSITLAQLRRTGRMILGSTLGEALGAVLVVFLAMLLVIPEGLGELPAAFLALAFGAIAAPTAPAATIAVLHQYHARGPLSSTLLGVVALDDALGIILFASVSVVTTAASLTRGIGGAAIEVLGSIALGLGMGFVLSRLAVRLHQGSLRLPLVVAAVLLSIGAAQALDLSALLAAMTLGFSSRLWLGAAGDRLFAPVEYFEELVFLIFFTLAGAFFDPSVLSGHIHLIAVYFFARILGKVAGAAAGARLSGAPPSVSRWLGLGLVPQAGVAVGLVLALGQHPSFRPIADILVNVILGSTLLYEISGPILVRFALGRAGELGIERRRSHPS
jgi:Kef-type K+ transport system membrane component KefB